MRSEDLCGGVGGVAVDAHVDLEDLVDVLLIPMPSSPKSRQMVKTTSLSSIVLTSFLGCMGLVITFSMAMPMSPIREDDQAIALLKEVWQNLGNVLFSPVDRV